MAKRKRRKSPGHAVPTVGGRRGRAAADTLPVGSGSLRYVESSAVLAALLEGDVAARAALRADGQRVTSALTFAESARALVRARAGGRITRDEERAGLRALQTFQRRCAIVAVTDDVLGRAGRPYPVEPIRTLDAIHLATAELLGEPPQLVTIVTRDARVRENAQALGYALDYPSS